MRNRSVIVLAVDGLGAGYLGPYGNTWIDTPALNRLASESFLLEQAIADGPNLQRTYRSYWQGLHAMCPDEPASPPPTLGRALDEAGVATMLLTDEPIVAEHPASRDFSERRQIPLPETPTAADEIHQTQLGRMFAAAGDSLAHACDPFLLWIHARGMFGPWDAPPAMRAHFADEDDPDPPDFVVPPRQMLDADYDPDELLGIVQAYAGQTALLDVCIGALLDTLAEDPQGDETALILTSPRGFPLGEHRRVGDWDDAIYSETVQVPWMMRLPDGVGAMTRSQALVQPADLYATLLDWFGVPTKSTSLFGHSLLPLVSGEVDSVREHACIRAETHRAIRTSEWFLHAGEKDELFVKPDDRWDANEVSSRCREVTEELIEALDGFERAAGG